MEYLCANFRFISSHFLHIVLQYLKSSSACNYLWEIQEPSTTENAENDAIEDTHSCSVDEAEDNKSKGNSHDSIYVRYETEYVVNCSFGDPKKPYSHRLIRDFEINDFKVKPMK